MPGLANTTPVIPLAQTGLIPLWQGMVSDGSAIYYDPAFRGVIEAHLQYLITSALALPIQIDPGLAYQYEYNFYGLLDSYGMPKELHWITLRMNGMTNPNQFDTSFKSLITPDATFIDNLVDVERTESTII